MADPVLITTTPPCLRLMFRGGADAVALCGKAFGLGLPMQACTSAYLNGRAALWLGPDEWLLAAPLGEGAQIAASLSAALSGTSHSLVDVSDQFLALDLSGAHVARLLNSAVILDLHETAFAVGMCTRTIFGKASILLWRTASNAFHLETGRSFLPYVMAMLTEAMADLKAGLEEEECAVS